MNESNQEATAVETPRDHNNVISELKSAVGKLARQEAKAVESDSLAATFNQDILDMAMGKVAQTPTRSIQTVSTEQAKHVKRAAKIRENNTELAGDISTLKGELEGMLTTLLAPYTVASADEVADEVADEETVNSAEEAYEE